MKICGRWWQMCCWSLQTSRGGGGGVLDVSTADPKGWRGSQGGVGMRRQKYREEREVVVWWEDRTHCHTKEKQPLHPGPPELGRGQTSTDWIWFIWARIIWTLLRIFFWWPANVTPILRMSLWRHIGTLSRDNLPPILQIITYTPPPPTPPSFLFECFPSGRMR